MKGSRCCDAAAVSDAGSRQHGAWGQAVVYQAWCQMVEVPTWVTVPKLFPSLRVMMVLPASWDRRTQNSCL